MVFPSSLIMACADGGTSLHSVATEGIKPIEVMPVEDWITWGTQGKMVTAIYQGTSELKEEGAYIEQEVLNGYITALLSLALLIHLIKQAMQDGSGLLAIAPLGDARNTILHRLLDEVNPAFRLQARHCQIWSRK